MLKRAEAVKIATILARRLNKPYRVFPRGGGWHFVADRDDHLDSHSGDVLIDRGGKLLNPKAMS